MEKWYRPFEIEHMCNIKNADLEKVIFFQE